MSDPPHWGEKNEQRAHGQRAHGQRARSMPVSIFHSRGQPIQIRRGPSSRVDEEPLVAWIDRETEGAMCPTDDEIIAKGLELQRLDFWEQMMEIIQTKASRDHCQSPIAPQITEGKNSSN